MDKVFERAKVYNRNRRALRAMRTIHGPGFKSKRRGLPRGRPSTSHLIQMNHYYASLKTSASEEKPRVWFGNLMRNWFKDSKSVLGWWDIDVVVAAAREASREELAAHFVTITENVKKPNDYTIVVRNVRKELDESFKRSKTGTMLMCAIFSGNETELADKIEIRCKRASTRAEKLITALRFCIRHNRNIRFDKRLFDPSSRHYCVSLANVLVEMWRKNARAKQNITLY